jgi:cellulose synthase/poly-beta-1,6-N-acetylglucosamine synthase-like glycosyltransferase/peptidoglycan/xylan/chitin deacetylase (PgdA/CDA1 family)
MALRVEIEGLPNGGTEHALRHQRMRGGTAPKTPRAHWVLVATSMVTLLAMLVVNGFSTTSVSFAPHTSQGTKPGRLPGDATMLYLDGSQHHFARTPRGVFALTFVGGPDPQWTPRILDALHRSNIKATFFVVGSRVNAYPDLARRILVEGHELGVSTFSGADPATLPNWQSDLELSLTQRAIAGATGRRVNLFRPPFSSTPPTIDTRTLTLIWRAGAAGYKTVLADYDSRDWASPGVEEIVKAALPSRGAGAVVRMQDSGGDRTQTVAAINELAPRIVARGYRFATISASFKLARGLQPTTAAEQAQGLLIQWAQRTARWSAGALLWVLFVLVLVETTRLVLQVSGAVVHIRRTRRRRASPGPLLTEPATVIVPAFNEAAGIEAAVRSLVASQHPVEVIVVDDGSTDNTAEIVDRLDLPGVRLIRQDNAGKPAALNNGIAHATHDLIVMVDGDTVFEPLTVTRLVQPFADPCVGAVSGNTKVGNRRGLLGRWQHLEYVVGFNLERRMFDVARCMPTIPGAIGAFRREVLLEVGGLSGDTLAEDTDLTMAVCRAAWTEVPATLRQLWRQRYRWTFGTCQAMWKHRHALIERGAAGQLGRRGLPFLVMVRLLAPLTAPAVDVLLLYSFIFGDPATVAIGLLSPLSLQVALAVISLRIDRESIRPAWALPLQLFVHRQLMYLVLIQSIAAALVGARPTWQRMHRTGSAAQSLPSRSV